MRENIINFLNNEIFTLKDDDEQIQKSLDFLSTLTKENKNLFLEIIINIKERKLNNPFFKADLFFEKLEQSNIDYDYNHILSYVSDDDSSFSNENIILTLMENEKYARNFVENPEKKENAFNILLTLFLNDKDIEKYSLKEKFDFSNKFFNNPHLQNRLEQNRMNGKTNINSILDNFFNLSSPSSHQSPGNNIRFILRNKKLNKFFLEHIETKNCIIDDLKDSDFKYLNNFEDSFNFLKEIENSCKNNPKEHASFLNKILSICNSNNEENEVLLKEFIIKNKNIINNDYSIRGEYTVLFSNYYKNENIYKILSEHIDIIKKENIDLANILNYIIKYDSLKEVSKKIREYIKDPLFNKNNFKEINYLEEKLIINPPLLSLIGNNTQPIEYIINNIPLLKILLKNGEEPDIKIKNEFIILDGLDNSIKYRIAHTNKNHQKKIIEIVNLIINHSSIDNIYEQNEILKTRNNYIFDYVKNKKNVDIDNLFFTEKLLENKKEFFIFCIDSKNKIKEIESNELKTLEIYFNEKIDDVINLSELNVLKEILLTLNKNDDLKDDELKNIRSKIENKILMNEIEGDFSSQQDVKIRRRI